MTGRAFAQSLAGGLKVVNRKDRAESQSALNLATLQANAAAKSRYRFANIPAMLAVQAERRGAATALLTPDGTELSYSELHRRICTIAGQLAEFGFGRSSRVAIVLPNGLIMAVMLLAVTSRSIGVPLNPSYREAEFQSYLGDIRADCVIVAAEDRFSAARVVARNTNIPVIEISSDGVTLVPAPELAGRVKSTDGDARPSTDDVALILLTSGSTGRSKKVPLTHRNLCASVADICHSLRLDECDACLSMWEQFHIGGLVDLLLVPLASGGRVICTNGFDAERFFHIVDGGLPTWFQGVPTTLHEIMALARKKQRAPMKTSLRFIRSVASALSPQLMQRVEAQFQVPVVQTFGMTEAGPLITTNPLPPGIRKPGSTGPSCGPELSIRDPEGRELPPGETGEIVVRGENVITGYEGNAEANAQSFRDGWFRTGDTGYVDGDGYLFLSGRIKEQINRGGEKIIPQEIDDVLAAHPEIEQVASFSVKHATLGEDVGVAVVIRDNSTLDAAAIRRVVADKLSGFKVPRAVLFLDSLPRNSIGKVKRDTLAALADSASTTPAYAAPETSLQEVLARIWAEELSRPRVGLDDDFVALGGDSLSSVRLALAIETVLGIELEAAALLEVMTVRQLAALIEVRPDRDRIVERVDRQHETEDFASDRIRDLLSNIASGRARGGAAVPDTAAGMKAALLACDTERTFDVMLQSFLSELTAHELEPLSRIILTPAEQRHPMQHKFLAAQKLLIEKVLPAAPEQDWRRRSLAKCVRLYSSPGADVAEKTLVVGFAGKALRLMLPMWTFLAHLDSSKYDLLFLWDPTRGHYRNGTPDLGDNFKDLVTSLGKIVSGLGHGKVISFGVSAGGLPAICAGIANRWDSIVTVGNDYPKLQTHLFPMLVRDNSEGAKEQSLRLYYSQHHPWDQASARAVAKMTNGEARAIADCSDHDPLWQVYRRGGLAQLFAEFFGETKAQQIQRGDQPAE